MPSVILWFRRDLRLADNPALSEALSQAHGNGGTVIPVYIHDPRPDPWAPGPAAMWWLERSLASLAHDLEARGSRLAVLRGEPAQLLERLARDAGASTVVFGRVHTPRGREVEREVAEAMARADLRTSVHEMMLLASPDAVAPKSATGEHGGYRVFAPYHRAASALPLPHTSKAPAALPQAPALDAAAWSPHLAAIAPADHSGPWEGHSPAYQWHPGEAGATKALAHFVSGICSGYLEGRERPDMAGTSRLSPHLAFGEISPWRIVRQVRNSALVHATGTGTQRAGAGAEAFLRQLYWREFASHVLHHAPSSATEPLRAKFAHFPWRTDEELLVAWREGATGYPIVDAGMRELAATGWMHNRVRMIVASFLTKDLLQPWQDGAAHFWARLLDADLANNTLGWQWVAGSGADAAPYFRVFNPALQGRKFDPDGAYVRRWVPELAGLEVRWVHEPWEAPRDTLQAAGVILGSTYPRPIVDHREARERALAAYRSL